MLAAKDVVALFEQPGGQCWIDVGAECGVQPSTLGEALLHAVEGGRQDSEVVVVEDGSRWL